jgi:ATP-dependent Clp protease ATP-binding subunit ClpC
MFENYTDEARRVIFWARHQVSELGSKSIDTGHLLLGLLRVDGALVSGLTSPSKSADDLRTQVRGKMAIGKRMPTSVDVPLSEESKKVLKYAAEESKQMSRRSIGVEHLLLGMLRQQGSVAESVLRENGLTLAAARQYFQRTG